MKSSQKRFVCQIALAGRLEETKRKKIIKIIHSNVSSVGYGELVQKLSFKREHGAHNSFVYGLINKVFNFITKHNYQSHSEFNLFINLNQLAVII